jgi:hypothetical protein
MTIDNNTDFGRATQETEQNKIGMPGLTRIWFLALPSSLGIKKNRHCLASLLFLSSLHTCDVQWAESNHLYGSNVILLRDSIINCYNVAKRSKGENTDVR